MPPCKHVNIPKVTIKFTVENFGYSDVFSCLPTSLSQSLRHLSSEAVAFARLAPPSISHFIGLEKRLVETTAIGATKNIGKCLSKSVRRDNQKRVINAIYYQNGACN